MSLKDIFKKDPLVKALSGGSSATRRKRRRSTRLTKKQKQIMYRKVKAARRAGFRQGRQSAIVGGLTRRRLY